MLQAELPVSRAVRPVTIHTFAGENEPVIVIDEFSGCIDRIEEIGRRAPYSPAVGFPGLRSPFDPRYLQLAGPIVGQLFAEHFGLRKQFRPESCSFSLVTTPPDLLSQPQRRPHYDGAQANLVATVHYTGGAQTGGTAFYRHRRSGLATIRPEQADAYEEAVAQDEREFGPLPDSYYYGDSDRYELIGEIEARPDRLIAYRGWNLHSGVIPVPPAPNTSARDARLSVNTFLIGQL